MRSKEMMRKKLLKSAIPAVIVTTFLLAGCQSLQQDKLYTSLADEGGLAELVELIVPLDKEPSRNAVSAARRRITELEKSSVKDRNFEGRIAAWSGRLFLIEGKPRDAEAQLKKAETLYPGSVEGRVLAIRLETSPEKRRDLCEASLREARGGGFFGQIDEFNIELGRAALELSSYPEAAAAFDSAFPRLNPVYRITYGEARNTAWQLRNLDPAASPKTAEISLRNAITWEDAVELSKNETELLRFLTGGRTMTTAELFKALVDRSIIPQAQDMTITGFAETRLNPTLRDIVLRAGAAWYIWHILAENRADRTILTRYSSRYSDRSPIPDLHRNSVFFDVVLGCIEREFMSLPDGKNFNGEGTVGGAEFLIMLKKTAGR
jgi:tetratricopeptide (TPR) repeat protein